MKTPDLTNLTTNPSELLNFENFKLGKEEGFTFFYTAYFQSLLRTGQHFLEHCPVVEELLNDAFLHTWRFRDLIECPRHLYCFTRLKLKWLCIRYIQQQKRERCYYYPNMQELFGNEAALDLPKEASEELEDLVYKAIPLLPPSRQNILKLYFSYGLSYQQIARRYCITNQQVGKQLQDSILFLKSVIKKKKQSATCTSKIFETGRIVNVCRTPEDVQREVFLLRSKSQYSFPQIAAALEITINDAKEKYVAEYRAMVANNY